MALTITEPEYQSLLIAHRMVKDKKQADRIKAMVSLHKGYSLSLICDILLVDVRTLRRWHRSFKSGGVDTLTVSKAASHNGKLSAEQEHALAAELSSRIYADGKQVQAKITELFGVSYSLSGVTSLLHRLGFSYHQPKLVPGKADADKQRAALAKLDELKSEIAPDRIYYADGVHPVHGTVAVSGWIKKGEVRQIKTNTGRDRLNINGALNLDGELVYREDKTLNADSTIKLFEQLLEKHPYGFVYFICDNAPYYYAKVVRQWCREHQRLVVIHLPPYSPNLNLIERLWRLLRDKVLVNTYYPAFKDFKQNVLGFLDTCDTDYPDELRTLLTAPCQIIEVGE
jgi:transposase